MASRHGSNLSRPGSARAARARARLGVLPLSRSML